MDNLAEIEDLSQTRVRPSVIFYHSLGARFAFPMCEEQEEFHHTLEERRLCSGWFRAFPFDTSLISLPPTCDHDGDGYYYGYDCRHN